MSIVTSPLPGTTRDPLYPDSDGPPMGETGFHVLAMVYIWQALRDCFAGRDDIYVATDMFLYYEKGNPRACKGPDVMFIRGVSGNHERRSFRIWEEGVAPTVIFEMTSKDTRYEDEVEKPAVYARLGVAEYFIFDPEGEYLKPRLQGFRLSRKGYVRIKSDAEGRLVSKELAMAIVAERYLPRLIELSTGRLLRTSHEHAADAKEARQRAELARKKAAAAKRKLAVERKALDAERRALEAERRRVAELEAELERLRRSGDSRGR
jgi:Uma2 family endonuclease